MGIPSLLVKGSLNAYGNQKQTTLDTIIPLDYIIQWFKDRKDKTGLANRILFLVSQTGSGKSTLLPATIYKEFIAGTSKRVISLQPTVVTTINITKEVVNSGFFPFLALGKNVGYSTGSNKLKAREGGITYATLGTLLMQMKVMSEADFLARYAFIIIDEAHKRTIDLEITILLLKSMYERNASNMGLPFLIFTSGTFEPDQFAEYFNLAGSSHNNIIFVAGEPTFPKEYFYTEKFKYSTFIEEAAECAITIHKKNTQDAKTPQSADILIFLPGQGEMRLVKEKLEMENEKLKKSRQPYFIILDIDREDISQQSYKNTAITLPVNEIEEHRLFRKKGGDSKDDDDNDDSELDTESESDSSDDESDSKLPFLIDNSELFTNNNITGSSEARPIRKIILATEAMETGMTIETLRYVIDTGYFKEMTYDPIYGATGLIMKPVSQASATQRFGRVGRKSPGQVYAMYSKEVFKGMIKEKFPEILTSDVSLQILTIISTLVENDPGNLNELPIGEFNPRTIDLLQPIPLDSLKESIEKCVQLGMISFDDSSLILGGCKDYLMNNSDSFINNNTNSCHNHIQSTIIGSSIASLNNYKLTAIGKVANLISIPITHSKMILSSLAWGAYPLDLIAVSSVLLFDKQELMIMDKKTRMFIPIKWDLVLKKLSISYLTELRERIIIASDFIRAIYLVDACLESINFADPIEAITSYTAFCKSINIQPDGMMEVFKIREKIINQLLLTGIDIFMNSDVQLTMIKKESLPDVLTRIRYCIYEGFKLQNATYDDESVKYICNQTKIPVMLPEFFNAAEIKESNEKKYGISWKTVPTSALYDKLMINTQPNAENLYKLQFNRVTLF